MADYTDLPNTAVGVGGIPSGTTVTALRDNPIAIAERASGAPKVVGANLDLIERVIVSGSPAAIDIAFDPSDYSSVRFVFEGVRPASGLAQFSCRTSFDSGATFDSGLTDYEWSYLYNQIGTTVLLQESRVNDNIVQLTDTVSQASNTPGVNGDLTIYFAGSRCPFRADITSGDVSGRMQVGFTTGRRLAGGTVNAMRFLWSTGNFANVGAITAYGVRKT